jgi:hypothetical protein
MNSIPTRARDTQQRQGRDTGEKKKKREKEKREKREGRKRRETEERERERRRREKSNEDQVKRILIGSKAPFKPLMGMGPNVHLSYRDGEERKSIGRKLY